ncbi:hypothetical protein [Oerskovia flava]|uniref:hypothetical protein n=1 Tax=Oerskovia flava TaxID=2986422 RepID=UPI00224008A0|nr:hypothetical protein [Oerskovia sp. JB1-3-2]
MSAGRQAAQAPRAGATNRSWTPWTVVAAVLMPVLVLGLLLWALWSPQDRLDTVKAAIVNNDEPVELDGQTVPLGRQLAAGLVSGGDVALDDTSAGASDDGDLTSTSTTNYDWEITDAEGAAAGLADGTYAAVVTIPEDFSAAATSFSGAAADAQQATIDVDTAPGGRVIDEALARIVTTAAATLMGTTLTENYVDGVLTGFTTLGEQLGEAADGAQELADGTAEAGSGAQELADGADQVAGGAGDLATGVGELDSGARRLAGGAGDLATGARSLAGGAAQSAAGAAGLAGGAAELADGVDGLAGGARSLADGVTELDEQVGALPDQAQRLADGSQQVADGVDVLVGELEAAGEGVTELLGGLAAELGCAAPASPELEEICRTIAEAGAGLGEGGGQLGELRAGAQEVADGNAALAAGLGALSAGTGELRTGAEALADGTEQTAVGAGDLATGARGLADGLGTLSGGAGTLATGAEELARGTSGLSGGVTALGDGATQLATGTEGVASGVGELAGGVGQLADGSAELADGLGQATEEIPTYGDAERENLAGVVANPVTAPGVDGLGTGSTGPLFAVVALWLGALALFVAFPAVPLRALGSTRSTVRLALSTLAVPAGLGAVTGLVTGAVLAAVEGASAGGWLGLMGLGVLVSVTFVALNQALAAALGNVGRGISLLIAVLALATGVVATVPDALVAVRDLLPVGPATDALVAVAEPGAGGAGGDIAALVVWSAVSVVVTILVVARRRTVRVGALLRA